MESIKIELYNLLKSTLKGLTINGEPIFKFIGHYNSPERDGANNFSYKTPAVFIRFDNINWNVTKQATPAQDSTRAQDGLLNFSLHFFFYDLRTDSDSFVDHLTIVDTVYYSILGLRSMDSIKGKISTIKRIREIDDVNFENLRHWTTLYQTYVQQTGISENGEDAQPFTFIINTERITELIFVAINDDINTPLLGYSSTDKIKVNA